MKHLPIKHGMELAPMVDVVFLLLAHFLLTATVGRFSVLDLKLPAAASGTTGREAIVTIEVDAGGRLRLQGQPLADAVLIGKVQAGLAKAKADQVRIAADDQAPYGRVLFVLDRLRAANILNVELAAEKR